MRYFRYYPPFLQLILLVMMMFTLISFLQVLQLLYLPQLTGASFPEIAAVTDKSSPRIVDAALWGQAITHASMFLLPALLFTYLTHPRPAQYLGLRRPGKKIHWIIVPLMMLGFLPVVLGLQALMMQLNLGDQARQMSETAERLGNALMSHNTVGGFMLALFVVAILPALGEELMFRGIVMRFAARRSKGAMAFPVVISALLFALIHFHPYGLPAIFLAGVLLALVYWWTGSLWLAILAHFMHNGTQAFLIYCSKNNAALQRIVAQNELPVWLIGAGLVLFLALFYLLYKNRTPLSPGWYRDFTPEEIATEQPRNF